MAVEILVKAKSHWMDTLTSKEVNSFSADKKQGYDARMCQYDVVAVRPEGWKWKKYQCLPNFIIIKVSDMDLESARKYEEQLTDTVIVEEKGAEGEIIKREELITLKVCKYTVSAEIVDNAVIAGKSVVKATNKDIVISLKQEAKQWQIMIL
jgi:hypothetical protein